MKNITIDKPANCPYIGWGVCYYVSRRGVKCDRTSPFFPNDCPLSDAISNQIDALLIRHSRDDSGVVFMQRGESIVNIRLKPGSAFVCDSAGRDAPQIVYLASPYSSGHSIVREIRVAKARLACSNLIKKGLLVYSPISHNHEIADYFGVGRGWQFWSEHDLAMLRACSRLVVLCINGWRESTGVTAEIKAAQEMSMPIEYLSESLEFKTLEQINAAEKESAGVRDIVSGGEHKGMETIA